ncbi:MAG TPA: AI-2E family transporter [Magnetospirillum sp.]|jgi:predicted PurR-regulated permease PerM|nr:AI-2E family transporter [Magnetospirillum sp.]
MDAPQPAPPPRSPPSPHLPGLNGLFVLAVLYTLHFAAGLILPLLVALLLAILLAPVAQVLRRLHFPRALAAALITASLVLGLGWGIEMLAAPAAEWLDRAPQSLRQLEGKLRPLKGSLEQVEKTTEQVERMAAGSNAPTPTVKVRTFALGPLAVAGTLLAQIVVAVVLLFFLLSSGHRLLRQAASLPADKSRRRRVFAVARRIKADVSAYLGTITLINTGMGLAAALALWALGMPNAALWGVLTGVLNYIPYGGPYTTMAVVGLVGLLTFDEMWRALLAPAVILALHVAESDVITPMVVGRRLTLPPLMVFLSLTVWTWMWGIAGAILAVPLLVVLKVAADHVEALRPLAPFLGGSDRRKV